MVVATTGICSEIRPKVDEILKSKNAYLTSLHSRQLIRKKNSCRVNVSNSSFDWAPEAPGRLLVAAQICCRQDRFPCNDDLDDDDDYDDDI